MSVCGFLYIGLLLSYLPLCISLFPHLNLFVCMSFFVSGWRLFPGPQLCKRHVVIATLSARGWAWTHHRCSLPIPTHLMSNLKAFNFSRNQCVIHVSVEKSRACKTQAVNDRPEEMFLRLLSEKTKTKKKCKGDLKAFSSSITSVWEVRGGWKHWGPERQTDWLCLGSEPRSTSRSRPFPAAWLWLPTSRKPSLHPDAAGRRLS